MSTNTQTARALVVHQAQEIDRLKRELDRLQPLLDALAVWSEKAAKYDGGPLVSNRSVIIFSEMAGARDRVLDLYRELQEEQQT